MKGSQNPERDMEIYLKYRSGRYTLKALGADYGLCPARIRQIVWVTERRARNDLLEALVDMVNQHCTCEVRDIPHSDPKDWIFDSTALSANEFAMKTLVKNGWAEEVGESVGRRMFIKILRWE